MSINLETGLWRCFKTSQAGNFIKLYSILENCPYRKAYEMFLFESFLNEDKKVEPEKKISNLEDTSSFEKFDKNKVYDNVIGAIASELILSRGMESFEFYISKDGFYKDRLIIPFFNSSNKLFFFQARALRNEQNPKYLNCKSLKSSEVLFPFDYGSYDPLFITEGVFDCLSLRLAGLQSTTTLSCNCSDQQMAQLRHYPGPLVVAYDSDKAGRKGVSQFMQMALKHKRGDLFMVTPDGTGLKDWNECLIQLGSEKLKKIASNFSELNKLTLAVSGL